MVRHSSRIELSQSALKRNFSFIRKKVGPNPIIASVVKANAYGHGIKEYVPIAEKCGITYFAVASSYEASEVLEVCSPSSRIIIMGILYPEDMEWVIDHDIEFYVFDFERLEMAKQVAERLGKKAIIHLEVETGGNRTGLEEQYFDKTVNYLKKHKEYLEFKGLCTHLAGAETLANHFRIKKQIEKYYVFYRRAKAKKILPQLRHIASSAAALSMPDTVLDLVRVGVAQYGFWPSPDIYNLHLMEVGKNSDNPIKRVFTWKTDVMHIKHVKKDEFIGYGTAYQAMRDMTVAVLPIGYSNGYSRSLSNNGFVLIHGKRAPICGLINMNLFMVDISHIRDVKVNDEVVLVGKQKNNTISISSFSEFSKQLNNELISRLPAAIPRFVVK